MTIPDLVQQIEETERLIGVYRNAKEVIVGTQDEVYHSVALKSDGTVWTWGRNGVGQLGDGTTIERHTPVRVLSLSGVTAIAAQSGHSLALRPIGLPFDGIVQAWGWNINGQLGDGTTVDRPYPVQVANLRRGQGHRRRYEG